MSEHDTSNGQAGNDPTGNDQTGNNRGKGNKPAEILRDGALKLSIFRNSTELGDNYAMVPGRIYKDKQSGQVREAQSLAGSEPLRMANLLTRGYDRVAQLREQYKEQNRDQQRGDRAPSRSRDSGRER